MLDGKVALITGGANGIGLATARGFGGAGLRLAIADRAAGPLEAAGAQLRAEGFEVLTLSVDVADEVACQAMVAAVARSFGKLDVAVNNAGFSGGGPGRAPHRR
ncbi:hypothetical protein MASR2M74_03780 [Paracoccaceae bacterium]